MPPRSDRARRVGSGDGAALIKLALILPLFLMLVLGMFSGGLAYNRKLELTHATREGARYGTTLSDDQVFVGSATWATTVRDLVMDRASGDLAGAQICVALVSGMGSGTTTTTSFVWKGTDSGATPGSTTVYMADGAASPRPYNEDNTDEGSVRFGAGSSTDWTTPDQSDQPVCSLQVLIGCYDSTAPGFALEDLALWTESAALSRIGGAGQIFLTGVFFLPNATFELAGQALQNVDRNAQFISRKLDMSGQGTLILRPNPNDSITIRTGISGLIR